MNQNKSAYSQETLPDNDFWLLRLFSILFQSGKIRDNLRKEFKSGSYIRWYVHVRHTYTQPHFSVYMSRGQDPNQHNKLFCTLQCTEKQKERHFLGEVHIALKEAGAQHPRAIISWTPPLLWLQWPQRQLFPLNDPLASPPPSGNRGPGTSACTPAWPGTGLCSLTPWHPPCCSRSRKRPPWKVSHMDHWPSAQGTGSSSWCLHLAGSVSSPRTDRWGHWPPAPICLEFHGLLWWQIWFNPSLPAGSRSWCSPVLRPHTNGGGGPQVLSIFKSGCLVFFDIELYELFIYFGY